MPLGIRAHLAEVAKNPNPAFRQIIEGAPSQLSEIAGGISRLFDVEGDRFGLALAWSDSLYEPFLTEGPLTERYFSWLEANAHKLVAALNSIEPDSIYNQVLQELLKARAVSQKFASPEALIADRVAFATEFHRLWDAGDLKKEVFKALFIHLIEVVAKEKGLASADPNLPLGLLQTFMVTDASGFMGDQGLFSQSNEGDAEDKHYYHPPVKAENFPAVFAEMKANTALKAEWTEKLQDMLMPDAFERLQLIAADEIAMLPAEDLQIMYEALKENSELSFAQKGSLIKKLYEIGVVELDEADLHIFTLLTTMNATVELGAESELIEQDLRSKVEGLDLAEKDYFIAMFNAVWPQYQNLNILFSIEEIWEKNDDSTVQSFEAEELDSDEDAGSVISTATDEIDLVDEQVKGYVEQVQRLAGLASSADRVPDVIKEIILHTIVEVKKALQKADPSEEAFKNFLNVVKNNRAVADIFMGLEALTLNAAYQADSSAIDFQGTSTLFKDLMRDTGAGHSVSKSLVI